MGFSNEVLGLIRRVLHSAWDPFDALLKHYTDVGVNRLDDLFALGFGDGGFLAGRVLTELGDDAASLGDDAIELIAHVGDDLAEAGADLSDEAVGGLGRLTQSLPTERAKRILDGLCPGTFAQISHLRPPGLACPLHQVCDFDLFERVLANIQQWDEAAQEGFERLARAGVDDETLASFLVKYADEPTLSKKMLGIVGNSSQTWSRASFKGLERMVDDVGIEAIEEITSRYSGEVIEQTFRTIRTTDAAGQWSAEGVEGVAKIIRRFDQPVAERVLTKQGRGEFGSIVFAWLNKVDDAPGVDMQRYAEWVNQLGGGGNTYVGTIFELKYAATELSDEGIRVINDYPDGRKGVDFIMEDGRYLELKDWDDYSAGKIQDAGNQFRDYLGIDASGNATSAGRYPEGTQFEHVFRKGGKNDAVVDTLCEVARQAVEAGVWSLAEYAAYKITFLDMPPILDKALEKGVPTAPPGPNEIVVTCP